MTAEEAQRRGERAKRLLEDPMLVEAFKLLETDIIEMWVACPERDKEGQERLQRHIRDARKLKDILYGIMENGKFELSKKSLADKFINKLR